ncbi:DUF4190 domain-containing protein [Aeromicrobium alkaliterrae]|uniref:Septum formation-related domain-containing protein n=1 Tax=Aeromicrobium alkaliterrae TaxID=302168 RepID=A0ABP4VP12_9ACTN
MTGTPPDPFSPTGGPAHPPPPSPVPQPGYPAPPGHPTAGYPGFPPGPQGLPPDPSSAARSRTQAVWALVLAIVPLCISQIVAVVLAIIVLVGPSDGQRRGKGMASASLVVVALWTVGVVVALVVGLASIPADRDDDGTVTSGGEVPAEDLRLGDCLDEDFFDTDADDQVYTVTVRPCDEPHTGEVYHEVTLDDGSYPGDRDVAMQADEACYQEFSAWVGTSYEDSELEYFNYLPTQESWDTGDRLITCVVISMDDVTGTLEGSSR